MQETGSEDVIDNNTYMEIEKHGEKQPGYVKKEEKNCESREILR